MFKIVNYINTIEVTTQKMSQRKQTTRAHVGCPRAFYRFEFNIV